MAFCPDSDLVIRSPAPPGGTGSYDGRRFPETFPGHKTPGTKVTKGGLANPHPGLRSPRPRGLSEPYCSARYASYGDELRSRHQAQQFCLRGRHEDEEYLKTYPLEGNLPHCPTGRKMAAAGGECIVVSLGGGVFKDNSLTFSRYLGSRSNVFMFLCPWTW